MLTEFKLTIKAKRNRHEALILVVLIQAFSALDAYRAAQRLYSATNLIHIERT